MISKKRQSEIQLCVTEMLYDADELKILTWFKSSLNNFVSVGYQVSADD